MSLTADILHITYDPIRKQVGNQCTYITDLLFKDYYSPDPFDVTLDNAPDKQHYLAASTAYYLFSGTRLFPAHVCTHYLTRKAKLKDNISLHIMPLYLQSGCIELVLDCICRFIATSNLDPLDKIYLNTIYQTIATLDDAAYYLAETIWYVIQVEKSTNKKRSA